MVSFISRITDNDPKGERNGTQITSTFTDKLNNTKVIRHYVKDEVANNSAYKLYVEAFIQFQNKTL